MKVITCSVVFQPYGVIGKRWLALVDRQVGSLVHSHRMKTKSAALYAGCAWQVVRFALLAAIIVLALFPETEPRRMLLFLWPAVGQLPIAAGFFFLARDPSQYAPYRRLLVLGKFLDIVPGLALLVYQATSLFAGVGTPFFVVPEAAGYSPEIITRTALMFHFGLLAVTFVDLIFLLLLLSFREHPEITTDEQESAYLPEVQAVELEDEE